ncbi:nuclear pore complex assembly-domain-containing protein [Myxozyma melibiosi]|uniref:Nuclear pore complex assembly-domain-containing protein n=1 Tax=Myxozyma melibiosi TaxID=54550 RepID=A0ABR1F9Y4_9ASCO
MDDEYLDAFEALIGDDEIPYSRDLNNRITMQRNKLDGYLFFDLWSSDVAGVADMSSLYPPQSLDMLRDLYIQVITAESDVLKQRCILYYLKKDFSEEAADEFCESTAFPATQKKLVDGIYALDRFDFETAMRNLTAPGVRLQFTEKMLLTLLQYSDNGPRYVRMLVFTSRPKLDSKNCKKLYLEALSRISVSSALEFVRTTTPIEDRAEYLQSMIGFCLSTGKPSSAYDIANLPLLDYEEAMILDYLMSKPDASAKNILLVRELHRGQAGAAREATGPMKNQISFGTKRTTQWAEMARKLKTNPAQIL